MRLPCKLIVLFSGLAVLLGLTACEPDPSQDALVLADTHLERNEFGKALALLNNARLSRPDDPVPELSLARLYLRLERGAEATQALQRARTLGASRSQWLIPLAQAYLLDGEYQKLLQEMSGEPTDTVDLRAPLLALKARAALSLERTLIARELLDQADMLNGHDPQVLLARGILAQSDGKLNKARQLFQTATQANPGLADAWLYMARLHRRQAQLDEARQAYQKALALNPIDPQRRQELIQVLIAAEQWQAVENQIDILTELYPDLLMADYLMGQALFLQGRLSEANAYLPRILSSQPDHVPTLMMLAATGYRQNQLAQAENHLRTVLEAEPEHTLARKLLAAVYLRQNTPRQAVEQLLPLPPSADRDPQWMLLLASAYLQDNQFDQAWTYLSRITAFAATSNVTLPIGTLDGTDVEARTLSTPIDLQQVLPSDMADVLQRLSEGDYVGAARIAEALAARRPDNPVYHHLLGLTYQAQDNLQDARRAFTKAIELAPDFSAAREQLARIHQGEGDLAAALEAYRRLVEQYPDDARLLHRLADTARSLGRHALAITAYEKLLTLSTDKYDTSLTLVQLYWDSDQPAKALEVLEQLPPDSGDPALLGAFGRTYVALGRPTEALPYLRQLATLKDTAAAWQLLAMAEFQAGGDEQALWAVEQALEQQADHLPSQVLRVSIASRLGRYAQALEYARTIQQQHPDQAVGFQLAGELHLHQQDWDAAQTAFRQAHGIASSSQTVVALAQALFQGDQKQEAVELFDDWLKQHPDDYAAAGRRGLYLGQLGQLKAAIAQYEDMNRRHPDNPVVLNNLAWLYHQDKDPRALDTARQAARLAPNHPEIADTLGWLLVQGAQPEQGLEVLRRAADHPAASAQLRYHLAVAYARTGQNRQARRILEQLLEAQPDFDDIEAARRLYQELSQDQAAQGSPTKFAKTAA